MTSKIVGHKILNIIYAKHNGRLSQFTLLHDIEKEYDIIRCALNGQTKLTIEMALYVLSKLYGESMAIQKLSEILKSVVEYKEDRT